MKRLNMPGTINPPLFIKSPQLVYKRPGHLGRWVALTVGVPFASLAGQLTSSICLSPLR